MRNVLGYVKNFYFLSVFFALNCVFLSTGNAQVFGATSSQETFQNTFSTQSELTTSKSQAKKPVQLKSVSENVSQPNDNQDKPVIRIYMDHFEILPTFSKMTHCSVVFHVQSTLKGPISNISFRLKWPNMETPISFDNIPAQGKSSKSYSLLGKGCYQMDATPTIIVNRCRVKGLTQEACADLIKWVK